MPEKDPALSKMASRVMRMPAGRRNNAGRRNAAITGAKTTRLNFEALSIAILFTIRVNPATGEPGRINKCDMVLRWIGFQRLSESYQRQST
jgi:hypothetical protein